MRSGGTGSRSRGGERAKLNKARVARRDTADEEAVIKALGLQSKVDNSPSDDVGQESGGRAARRSRAPEEGKTVQERLSR